MEKSLNSITFKGWVARDKVSDEYYPRTFLYARKSEKKQVYYYSTNLTCEYEDGCGRLGSYDLKNLLPDLKFSDGPVEVEVTVRLINNYKIK